jgi:uncharacterized protein YegL
MMPKTLVTFLLDRSGSMSTILDDTIGGFNTYLETLQQGDDADNVFFSLVQFDSMGIDKCQVNESVKEVPRLDRTTFVPRGGTPLIDAAYKTIKAVEKSVQGNPSARVVICIQTDGEENSSMEYTWMNLNSLIKEKIAAGWQFNFMGASIDAYSQASKMGISAGATMSYNAKDGAATQEAFAASASNTMSYARGASLSTEYTRAQKSASGDAFMDKGAWADGGLDDLSAPAPGLPPQSWGGISPDAMQIDPAKFTGTPSIDPAAAAGKLADLQKLPAGSVPVSGIVANQMVEDFTL